MGGGGGNAEQAVKNYAAGTLRNEPLWFDYTWQGDQAFKTGIYSKYKAEWSPGTSITGTITRNRSASAIGVTANSTTDALLPPNLHFSMPSPEESFFQRRPGDRPARLDSERAIS